MYMFPRQFGLHNAFTSHVDRTKTAQKFQDYTLREEEISVKFPKTTDEDQRLSARVPKRLRGEVERLIQRMQTFHARCSYAQLLEHHCPVRIVFHMESFFTSVLIKTSSNNSRLNNLNLPLITVAALKSLHRESSFRGRLPGVAGSFDPRLNQLRLQLTPRPGETHL